MDELEKIEAVKKEADLLMMNKIIKYEAKIAELKKELEETRNDNKKLAEQVDDYVDKLRKGGII
jgi:uncharacterized coiled-coil DUF342 family protein|tara:strand:- start:152 stop:343 length:192 start_codon:yes stop_codon:yes gene_type:complete